MSREKRLKMKKLEPKHLIEFNQLLRYVFQVTNHDLQEVGWEAREIALAKLPVLEQADVIGWFDRDKLVSQLAVYPFQVRIFNQTYDMGGLTGVGTYPEYANMGLMDKLMRQALADMRQRKQSISYLFPYSVPYYRRKGWEIISDKMTFEVDDFQLPKIKTVLGEVERVDINHKDIRVVYERFAYASHGAMIRNELAWGEYWRWDVEDLTAAIYYNSDREPKGYLLYWISNEVFHIKEMVFVDEEARSGLWNFISAHFSMVSKVIGNTYTHEPLAFLLEDADIKETISPYFMARIVDVEQFISQYPFKPHTEPRVWTFTLDDPLLEWNQGIFTVHISPEGKAELTRGGDRDSTRLDIRTLTTMLFSYKRPDYLHRIGRLVCSLETLEQLEDMIDQQTPYFSDYF
ncbi:GNAT family N-acetyltransferase [Paenibacillus pinihumi]|uniref:GNAT family N-acetyltransferase n=1 Tax=Paenibacillus pinihumi TaxID=669462 RepID=UPI000413A07B|nr:GNAT family N-acetyltransferase [Paenibacillus pinihumi]